jgi:hypothetical protein
MSTAPLVILFATAPALRTTAAVRSELPLPITRTCRIPALNNLATTAPADSSSSRAGMMASVFVARESDEPPATSSFRRESQPYDPAVIGNKCDPH